MKSCFSFILFLLWKGDLGRVEGRGRRENKDGQRRRRRPEESCWQEIYTGTRRWFQKALVAPRVPSSGLLCFLWFFPLF